MFWIKKPRWTMEAAVRSEVNGLCHASQIEALNIGAHLRKDIGLDCGCTAARHHSQHFRLSRQ